MPREPFDSEVILHGALSVCGYSSRIVMMFILGLLVIGGRVGVIIMKHDVVLFEETTLNID